LNGNIRNTVIKDQSKKAIAPNLIILLNSDFFHIIHGIP
jgi:hypothetical protein